MSVKYLSFFGILVFFIDRFIKDWLFFKIPDSGYLFFDDFFGGVGIYLAHNKWAAFSFEISRMVLILLSVLLLGYLVVLMKDYYKEFNSGFIFLSLIFLGGASNLIDRFVYGGVHDYIKIFIWPIFNLADCLIVVGIFLFGLAIYKKM